MTTKLDFPIVNGNNDTISIDVLDKDDAPVILTGMTIKWCLFFPDGSIAVTKLSSQIAISNSTAGVANRMSIAITPSDTISLPQGNYPHEAITVSTGGNVATVTDNDDILSYGTAFIRQQLTTV